MPSDSLERYAFNNLNTLGAHLRVNATFYWEHIDCISTQEHFWRQFQIIDQWKTENTLSWKKLFDIAIGIARGLEYLHRGMRMQYSHRNFDIKPHSTLLDLDFCPKISDFGLAKLCLNKESAISIGGARGTIYRPCLVCPVLMLWPIIRGIK